MSDSVQPHRWQLTRLPHPWDSPGRNTGVGCHFLLQCMKVKSESEVTQLCLTLSNPVDCSLPGFAIHGIFQARVLEWSAIAFSGKHHRRAEESEFGIFSFLDCQHWWNWMLKWWLQEYIHILQDEDKCSRYLVLSILHLCFKKSVNPKCCRQIQVTWGSKDGCSRLGSQLTSCGN